jgi:hypothetical protein
MAAEDLLVSAHSAGVLRGLRDKALYLGLAKSNSRRAV